MMVVMSQVKLKQSVRIPGSVKTSHYDDIRQSGSRRGSRAVVLWERNLCVSSGLVRSRRVEAWCLVSKLAETEATGSKKAVVACHWSEIW